MVGHSVADTGFGAAINGGSQIQPALLCRNIGDVTYYFLTGSLGSKIPLHQVRSRAGIIRRGGGRPIRPGLAGDQVKATHQLAHELEADLLALTHEVGVHPAIPIRLIGKLKNGLDECFEVLAAIRGGRSRPVSPLIISRLGNVGPLTHLHKGKVSPLRVDELEFRAHRDSWAKKAAAFPKNSAFILSSRFSFSSSRRRARSVNDNGCSSSG